VTAKGTTRGLIVTYVLLFMGVGITLPFLPGYLSGLGLSGSQVGVLLAVGPTLALLSPPVWGLLADRSGRGGLILVVLCVGAAGGYGLLTLASGFLGALVALAVVQLFASSMTSQLDALALHHVHGTGEGYASLRLWGSVGFVAATLGFGLSVDRLDRAVVVVPLILMLIMGLWTALTLAREAPRHFEGPRPGLLAAAGLLRRSDIALLLAATALHWMASAPYHGILTLHITSQGWAPRVISLSAAVAVSSEVLVMLSWPRWGAARSSRELLAWAFGASAVRWALLAVATGPALVVASSALHGMTFGAFYLAAVASMTARVAPSLRATGQSLFVAVTFGLGGLVGFSSAGWLYDAVGGHRLFALAAAAEALPMLAIWLADRPPPKLAG
jgi:PPP family 3-phenylpropionic acid transporter